MAEKKRVFFYELNFCEIERCVVKMMVLVVFFAVFFGSVAKSPAEVCLLTVSDFSDEKYFDFLLFAKEFRNQFQSKSIGGKDTHYLVVVVGCETHSAVEIFYSAGLSPASHGAMIFSRAMSQIDFKNRKVVSQEARFAAMCVWLTLREYDRVL